jgi:single-stranded DNA-specific DHH superfamily exonuclease
MKTVIFADEDPDGLISTHLVRVTKNVSEQDVIFSKWNKFGLDTERIPLIKEKKPDELYILDIGSDLEMLKVIQSTFADIPVHIFDNHPPRKELLTPTEWTEYEELLTTLRKNPNFTYVSTEDNCTTGLVYDYITHFDEKLAKWAVLGITADVASETPEGSRILQAILPKCGFFTGLIVSKAVGGKYDWGVTNIFTQLLSTPRRILLDDSPLLCLRAMSEMDSFGDWFKIYQALEALSFDSPQSKDLKSHLKERFPPNLSEILGLFATYKQSWKTVFEPKNHYYIDYPTFGLTVISSDWNIGSAVANVYATEKKKPQIVINTFSTLDLPYHVSGRCSEKDGFDIGKLFKLCDPILKGGGLKVAGSANATIKNIEKIIDTLVYWSKDCVSTYQKPIGGRLFG